MQADNSEIRSNSIQDKSHKPCWCLSCFTGTSTAGSGLHTILGRLARDPSESSNLHLHALFAPCVPTLHLEIQSYHRPPKIMYPAVRQSLPKSEHSCKVHIGIALGCIWCRMLQNAKGPGTHIVYTLALCKTSFKAKVKHSKVHGPLGQDRHVH